MADDPIDPRLHLLCRQVLVEAVGGALVEGSGEHILGSRPLEDQGQQVPPAAHDEVVGAAEDHPNLRGRQKADSFRVQVIGNALDPAAHLLVSTCSPPRLFAGSRRSGTTLRRERRMVRLRGLDAPYGYSATQSPKASVLQ